MDIAHLHNLFLQCQSVSTDSRKTELNSMFFAIKGAVFDANTFAAEALQKGALFVIIDNASYFIDQRTILVENSLIALQELAKFHRAYLQLPIIALTGSNGKTTTKELIHIVLSKKYNTKATIGNLNNHIGVPLTLLSFTKETEIGIVEMGANHKKEIEFLCELTQPDFGYVSNFGKAHLEGFGGIGGVIEGKSELYNYLFSHNKIAFVNLDDPIQAEKTTAIKKFTFGYKKANADIVINAVTANPFVVLEFDNQIISSHLIGLYNADNISAALTIGKYFKIENSAIKEALESYIPKNNRSQLLIKGTNEIILDAYNANPSSMAVAIRNFIQLEKQNKVMILGDMFELGSESEQEHKIIVNSLSDENKTVCYFIGSSFYKHKIEKENLYFFDSFDDFAVYLGNITFKEQTVLIKGSRGMALERVLNFI